MDMSLATSYVASGAIIVLFLIGVCNMMKKRKHLTSLEGKHVVITGGSSGIGFALAKECLSQGAFVTLIARNSSRLSKAAHTLSSSSSLADRILLKAVDVGDVNAVSATIVECFEWKPIDILICNAGISSQGIFDNKKMRDMDELIKTNLMGCVYPVRVAIPYMKARSKQYPSSIVFMSSISGLFFVCGGNVYPAAKYGLKGLAELLRFELMPHNIKISLVCPGFTETPMLDNVDRADPSSAYLLRKIQFYNRANAESADDVAAKTMEGVKRGQFLITTSTLGFFIGVIGRGFVPPDSLIEALLELVLLVPVRLSSFIWVAYAKRVVRNMQEEED